MQEFSLAIIFTFGLLGSFAGFLAGLLGLGGGIIYIPLFLVVFEAVGFQHEIIVHTAFGTSLAIIFFTAISSSLVHFQKGNIEWYQVYRLALGSACGAIIGAQAAAWTPGIWLKALFGIMLTGVAIHIFSSKPQALPHRTERISTRHLFLVGMAGGSFAAFFGVSGAVVVLPLMILALKIPMHSAIANSSALIVVSCFVGTLSYMFHGWHEPSIPQFSLGYVNVLVVGICTPFTTLFARIGAKVAHRFSHDKLVRIFAVVLIIVGLRMLIKTFFFS
ncbi:MAG: sulfite exporter TauE/SafE family protein [Deltaproteobacteria bacterium]|nr:sulfite exporter TauE/SafE family protein [Deltaproteobacteria bacterium]